MKGRNKMRIISHHVRFTRFAITSTVEEATFDSDEATFEVEQTSFESDEATFESNETTVESSETTVTSNVTTFNAKEVPFGSHAFTLTMNTILSEAVTATSASDAAFFTTEHVTSVAEEIIGDVPVMSLSTINKQTERRKNP